MFERYTEKARRTIFFARYEASQFGSLYIESEHVLLGLLRESKALSAKLLANSPATADSIRKLLPATSHRNAGRFWWCGYFFECPASNMNASNLKRDSAFV